MTDPTNPTPGKSKSQNQLILEYLQSGKTLSPLQALELFNCWALSSRCADLNKQLANEGNGHRIDCKLVKDENTGKKYGVYSYVWPMECIGELPDIGCECEQPPIKSIVVKTKDIELHDDGTATLKDGANYAFKYYNQPVEKPLSDLLK